MYTDYIRVAENLNDPRFKLVDNPKEAKILWLTSDYEQKRFLDWEIDEKNPELSRVRLFITELVKQKLNRCFNLLVISSPESI